MPKTDFRMPAAVLTSMILLAASATSAPAGHLFGGGGGCNCSGRSAHSGGVAYGPAYGVPHGPAHHLPPMAYGGGHEGGDPGVPSPAPLPLTVHKAVSPPPGTLGVTYRQSSRLIPDDKHPRIGMVEIFGIPVEAKVTIPHMEGFRKKDSQTWMFESEKPLLPGTPHIYPVTSKVMVNGHWTEDVRTIRLIPGRIVYLEFNAAAREAGGFPGFQAD